MGYSGLAAGDSVTMTCKGLGVPPSQLAPISFWLVDDINVNPVLDVTTKVSVDEVSYIYNIVVLLHIDKLTLHMFNTANVQWSVECCKYINQI